MRRHFWAVIVVCSSAPVYAADGTSINDVVAKIAASEAKVKNVKVVSTFKEETWDAATEKWQLASEGETTSWFDGTARGKARVDFQKHVTRWIDGPAPYSESKSSHAFNGRIGQELQLGTGPIGKYFQSPRGRITAYRPNLIVMWGNRPSGYSFFLNGEGGESKNSLSQQLQVTLKAEGIATEAHEGKLNDLPCTIVTVGAIEENIGVSTWYLDPARGFAIVAYQRTTEKGVVGIRYHVNEFAQPIAGVFYPTDVSVEYFDRQGVPTVRAAYKSSTVVVNDPKWVDDVFTLKWPVGTPVYDDTTGVSFIASEELFNATSKMTSTTQTQVATTCASASACTTQPSAASTPATSPDASASVSGRGNSPWLLPTATGLAALLVLAIVLRHHSRRKQ